MNETRIFFDEVLNRKIVEKRNKNVRIINSNSCKK
jgi:hypothetical protein